jgi:hypothetical protein
MAELTLEQKLEKIQKLMARATGTNHEAEAQTCFLKAQKLMAEWNIDARQLDEHDAEGREVVRETVTEVGPIKVQWKATLAALIAKNFRCKQFFWGHGSARYIVFFGIKEDAVIAHELYAKAIKCISKGQDRIIHKYLREGRSSSGIAGDYAEGFVVGLDQAFKNQVDEYGWGLVVSTPEEVKAAYEKIEFNKKSKWDTTSNTTRGSYEAFEAGRLDGKDLVPSQKRKALK